MVEQIHGCVYKSDVQYSCPPLASDVILRILAVKENVFMLKEHLQPGRIHDSSG